MMVKFPGGGFDSVTVNVKAVVPLLPSFCVTSLMERNDWAAASAVCSAKARVVTARTKSSRALRRQRALLMSSPESVEIRFASPMPPLLQERHESRRAQARRSDSIERSRLPATGVRMIFVPQHRPKAAYCIRCTGSPRAATIELSVTYSEDRNGDQLRQDLDRRRRRRVPRVRREPLRARRLRDPTERDGP